MMDFIFRGRRFVLLCACTGFVAGGFGVAALAEVGRVGQQPTTQKIYNIHQAAENKRISELVDKIIKKREKQKQEDALKLAAEEFDSGKGDEADKNAEGAARAVSDATAEEPEKPPALVLNFSRRYVNIDQGLRRLITSRERSKIRVRYDIVSEIPAEATLGSRNELKNNEYEDNLNRVIAKFNDYGVQSSRITVTSKPSNELKEQRISIYEN
jgi:hypothetical protein